MSKPISNGDKRNPDGTFAEGNPGGPGRPVGSVSIVGMIKKKFEEDPEYFKEWIGKLMEDPNNRRAIMEQIDGKPKQSMDVTSGGEPMGVVVLPPKNNENTLEAPAETIKSTE